MLLNLLHTANQGIEVLNFIHEYEATVARIVQNQEGSFQTLLDVPNRNKAIILETSKDSIKSTLVGMETIYLLDFIETTESA